MTIFVNIINFKIMKLCCVIIYMGVLLSVYGCVFVSIVDVFLSVWFSLGVLMSCGYCRINNTWHKHTQRKSNWQKHIQPSDKNTPGCVSAGGTFARYPSLLLSLFINLLK